MSAQTQIAKQITMWVISISVLSAGLAQGQEKTFSQLYATVNGKPVTRAHVELLSVQRGVKPPLTEAMKRRLIKLVMDRRLVSEFLEKQNVRVDRKALRREIEVTRSQIQKTRGEDPDDFFRRILINRKSLQEEVGISVRWNTWLEQTLDDAAVKKEFNTNKPQYDGTRVRMSQIFIKASEATESEMTAAETQLRQIRTQIVGKQITFAAAAAKYSQAPTATTGGDVGWLTYVGKMPKEVSAAAFTLKSGEVSQPIRSGFGVHLCVVTDRKPGDLSPEDARGPILRKLAEAEWSRIVESGLKSAKINKP